MVCTSRARNSLPLTRKLLPSPREIRRVTSNSEMSLLGDGANPAASSRNSITSATLRPARVAVPAKITSSISPPRIALGEVSPMAQRSASTTLDLPQPLGPTMPVRPGNTSTVVASAKDLKPAIRMRDSLALCAARAWSSLRAASASGVLISASVSDGAGGVASSISAGSLPAPRLRSAQKKSRRAAFAHR